MHQVSPLELQKYLAGVGYPATKHSLHEVARENGAPEDVLKTIEHLSDIEFDNPEELMSVFGDTAFGDTAEQQDEANRDVDISLGEGEDEGDMGFHIETLKSPNGNGPIQDDEEEGEDEDEA